MSKDWNKAIDEARVGRLRKDTILESITYAIKGEYRGILVDRDGNFIEKYRMWVPADGDNNKYKPLSLRMTPMWFGLFPWFSEERIVHSPADIMAYRTGWRKWVRIVVYCKLRSNYG